MKVDQLLQLLDASELMPLAVEEVALAVTDSGEAAGVVAMMTAQVLSGCYDHDACIPIMGHVTLQALASMVRRSRLHSRVERHLCKLLTPYNSLPGYACR